MERSTGPADDQRIMRALLLLQRHTRALTRIAVESLTGDGTNGEVRLFLALHLHGPQSPSTLAQEMGLDRSQTSRMLRRLEQAGVVTRASDQPDGRRSTVRLTAAGRRRIAAFDSALADYLVDSTPMTAEVLTLIGGRTDTAHPAGGSLAAASRMTATGQEFSRRAVAALAPFGVRDDTGERFVLGLLLAGGGQRPGALADALGRSPAYTSARLGRLESAGLITRRLEGGTDGRAVLVDLTARGCDAARAYLRVFTESAPAIAAALAAMLAGARATQEIGRTG